MRFGNPFFPYLNQIFRSPYFEPTEIWDPRFIPDSFWKLMTFPFYWTRTGSYVVSEPAFRDWRAAIAYVAIVIGVLALAAHFWRGRRLRDVVGETPGLPLVLAFVVVSYFSWALQFGYYRYAIPLEMPTGVIAMGTVIWLFRERRLRLAAAVAVLCLALTTTVYLDWGRRPYTGKYVEVSVPALPPDGIVLIATWDPAAYFIPYAEPRVQYLGIENNYLELSQTNKLATEVKRLMRTPGRPKFVVSVGDFDAGKLNQLLGQFRSQAERGAVPAGALEPGGPGDQPLRGGVRRRHREGDHSVSVLRPADLLDMKRHARRSSRPSAARRREGGGEGLRLGRAVGRAARRRPASSRPAIRATGEVR